MPKRWCVKTFNAESDSVLVDWTNSERDIRRQTSTDIPHGNCTKGFTRRDCWYFCFDFRKASKNYPDDCVEITFEQFKKYVLKEKPMKEKFPKDDFGVIVYNNNGKEIVDYLVSKGFDENMLLGGNACNNCFYTINKGSKYLNLQSCNYTSKTYTLQQLKNLENNMETIGYKAPHDLFGGRIKKGTLYYVAGHFGITNKEYGYASDGNGSYNSLSLTIPSEIVELWEPVYKSKEIELNLSNNKKVLVGKNLIKAAGQEFNIDMIKSLLEPKVEKVFADWRVEIKEVTYSIGCWKDVTKANLELIVKTYEEYN